MKALGYSLTWKTNCFLGPNNVGCGELTFAHTNGFGDFVLFDSLGYPWPIHSCYANRGDTQNDVWSLLDERVLPKPKKTWSSGSDIKRVDPKSYLSSKPIPIVGYLQDYYSGKRDELLGRTEGLEARIIERALGNFPDQLTIVVSDAGFNPLSYTVFSDLNSIKPQKKDTYCATVKAISLGRKAIFVAENLVLIDSAGRKRLLL
ncbi:MAG TPA: hypothetical protein VG844_01150 [Terracidiphilus sp.]|nr:hypothetical protein [Terracidiphilus sp.]